MRIHQANKNDFEPQVLQESNTLGLYSELRACNAMAFKSSLQSMLTVETMFLWADTHKHDDDGNENVQI